jgi:hypothetical protein
MDVMEEYEPYDPHMVAVVGGKRKSGGGEMWWW